MNVLLVYCHPVSDSFAAAIRDAALAGLTAGGHQVRTIDLYGSGFNPVMSAEEWRGYHTPGENEKPIAEHLDLLRWCQAVVFVYPTWWYGPPAMLKGWLERVWVPYATFTMPEPGKPIRPVLTQIKRLTVVSTLGSPWWWWRFIMQEPGRRTLLRGLRSLCSRTCRTQWIALHNLDTVSDEKRRSFLAMVEKKLRVA